MELNWDDEPIVLLCIVKRMMIDEGLIVLFMFAYQIWWILRWEQPQGRDGKRKRKYGWDSSKRKRICGRDSHKKRAGIPANVRGCEFDKQTWKEKDWHYTVYDTDKSDSVTNSVVVWNYKICVVLKILYYTDDYTGWIDRVANRVLA